MPRRGCVLTSLLVAAAVSPGAGGCAQPVPGQIRLALGGSNVLVLDLDGGPVVAGGSDDAVASVSALGAALAYPAYAAGVGAPTVAAGQVAAVLVDRVRGFYLPFDLDVVTERPASGAYAAILVGGKAESLSPAAPSGIAGVASLDCGDANARSLGFAFSDSLAPQFGGLPSLAAAIAHEAGHGYGLEHSSQRRDPMYSVALPQQSVGDLFSLSFQSGDYSPFVAGGGAPQPEACGHASPIDNHALLGLALGLRTTPLSAPPVLAIDFPPELAVLPPTLPVEVSASDDVGIVRVEIYRDLELVRVLDSPPYRTVLELPIAAATVLTIEAIDGDAQRAKLTRSFAVEASAASACDEAMPCLAPGRCVARFCVPPAPSLDAGSGDAAQAVEPGGGGGCAMARGAELGSARPGSVQAGAAPFGLLCLVVAMSLRLRLRSRRTSLPRG